MIACRGYAAIHFLLNPTQRFRSSSIHSTSMLPVRLSGTRLRSAVTMLLSASRKGNSWRCL